MARTPNPKGLGEIGEHTTTGGTVVKSFAIAQRLTNRFDSLSFDAQGLLDEVPSRYDPPEAWTLWSLSEQIRAIDKRMGHGDDLALLRLRVSCLSEISSITKAVRSAMTNAANSAIGAAAKAESLRIAKHRAGIKDQKTIDVSDLDLTDEELEEQAEADA